MEARTHPYLPSYPTETRRNLLKTIGVSSTEELYADIPPQVRLKGPLKIPSTMTQQEVEEFLAGIFAKNRSTREISCFLGAGCWPHYVPAAVDAIVSRGEFLTSYTPYQAEISQGMLQALFEYQSMIAELTGMEVANSSNYDWATSLGEAARMAVRVTNRNEILIPKFIHPEREATLRSYVECVDIRVTKIRNDIRTGLLDLEDLQAKLSDDTAAVYIENPSYLGNLETQVDRIAQLTHKTSALFVVGVDPISLGVLKPPGDYEADIVIGEGQPLGLSMGFGGPLLGVFACRGEKLLRQMPGRLIGLTTTVDETQQAFCLALQTREQHIRRERATSNICTNEALLAVGASAYLSLLGSDGLKELGKTILTKSHYAMKKLGEIPGVRAPLLNAPHFKEFTVNFDGTKKKNTAIHDWLVKHGIQGGKPLHPELPELGESCLFCVTEIHSRKQIDVLSEALSAFVGG